MYEPNFPECAVNFHQTKDERAAKYLLARQAGLNAHTARRVRDFRPRFFNWCLERWCGSGLPGPWPNPDNLETENQISQMAAEISRLELAGQA